MTGGKEAGNHSFHHTSWTPWHQQKTSSRQGTAIYFDIMGPLLKERQAECSTPNVDQHNQLTKFSRDRSAYLFNI